MLPRRVSPGSRGRRARRLRAQTASRGWVSDVLEAAPPTPPLLTVAPAADCLVGCVLQAGVRQKLHKEWVVDGGSGAQTCLAASCGHL